MNKHCGRKMRYVIDCSGGTYTAYLLECPVCGKVRVLDFEEDDNLDINNDRRYYEYGKKELF